MPGKERKDLVKRDIPVAISRHRLIHSAITPAEDNPLFEHSQFAIFTDTVFVNVVVDPVFQPGKPLEDRNITEVTGEVRCGTAAIWINGDAMEGKNDIHIVIPNGQLVVAGRDIVDAESTVAVNASGVESIRGTSQTGITIQADPWRGVFKRSTAVKGGVWWTGKMEIGDLAGDGLAATKHYRIDKRFNEPDKDMYAGRPELGKKWWFIRFDPGIYDFCAFDGRGLLEVGTSRWHSLNSIFTRSQVFNSYVSIRSGDQWFDNHYASSVE